MFPYLVKRVAGFPLTLIGILAFVFLLIRWVPGHPADVLSSVDENQSREGVDSERRSAFIQEHGLDLPLSKQAWRWAQGLANWPPDLGKQMTTGRPVVDDILEKAKVSIPLGAVSLLLIFGLSIPLGLWSALHRGRRSERLLHVLLLGLYSAPAVWVGTLLTTLLCGQGVFHWFPLIGIQSDHFDTMSPTQRFFDVTWHAVLPILCMSYGSLALLTRQTRQKMLWVLESDSLRTARSKGLTERQAVLRHGLKQALVPVITMFGLMLPTLVAGSVVVETLFNLPGLGQYAWQGVLNRDYNIVMAMTLLASVVTLTGVLIADLGHAWLDPRVRTSAF